MPEIETAEKELLADRVVEQARTEWAQHDRINALRHVEEAERGASPDNSYVRNTAKQLRMEIADFILKEAPDSPASLKDTLNALERADSALSVYDADAAALELKIDQASKLASLVFDRVQNPSATVANNSARIGVETLRRFERWINTDERFVPQAESLSKAAYPALQVRLIVGDTENCEGSHHDQLIAAIRQSLGRVARLSESDTDLTIRIKKISCSSSDVPMDNTQQVNSTYVAGYTQLANPAYVQLQEQLASAQQDLNRAEYANSTNPNFGNALAVGFAQGRVNRVRSALAATPPYYSQEITQQYKYQRFDAYRAYQVQAVIEGDQGGKNILGEQTVTSLKQDRESGVTGVLPQDKSGARNSDPALKSVNDCAKEAWEDVTGKTASGVNELVATLLAKRAMDASRNPSDRLASIMYLSEVTEGTRESLNK